MISDAGLSSLRKLPHLERLSLARTPVTDIGIQTICEIRSLSNISLAQTAITDAVLAELARLPELCQLDLSDTAITDRGLIHVRSLAKLAHLGLDNTAVTDEGVKLLASFKYKWEGGLQAYLRGTNTSLPASESLTVIKEPESRDGTPSLFNLFDWDKDEDGWGNLPMLP